MLARADNFLNLDFGESDPDWMAVEYFTTLQNQELSQVEIEIEMKKGTFATSIIEFYDIIQSCIR